MIEGSEASLSVASLDVTAITPCPLAFDHLCPLSSRGPNTALGVVQVKVDSDKYYLALKGDRTITRPEQIPKQQSELIDRTMQELADLELSCTQHVAEAVKKLRAQVRLPSVFQQLQAWWCHACIPRSSYFRCNDAGSLCVLPAQAIVFYTPCSGR